MCSYVNLTSDLTGLSDLPTLYTLFSHVIGTPLSFAESSVLAILALLCLSDIFNSQNFLFSLA